MVRRLRWLVALLACAVPAAACGSSSAEGVALPDSGHSGFAIVGRIDQNGPTFTFYGYLTTIDGLDGAQLFAPGTSPADRNEATALFTFHGTSQLTGRSILENLFTVDAEGGISVFYSGQPAGATFDDPNTFTKGTIVASMNGEARNLITVTAPNTGLDFTTVTLTQTDREKFKIGDEDYQFGAKDAVWRLTANGSGTRLDPDAPVAVLNISGDAVVLDD